MKENKERREEALRLLNSSDPNEVDTGAHWLNPGAHPVDQVVEAVGKQRLIEHCLVAFGINEVSADPTLESILSHFTIADIITAYKKLGSNKNNGEMAFRMMTIIEDCDPELQCIIQYPYPQGLQVRESSSEVNIEEQRYCQNLVNQLLSASGETIQSAAEKLGDHSAYIHAIVQSVGQQQLLVSCLRCYDIFTSYKVALDKTLSYFSLPQLAQAYVIHKRRRKAESLAPYAGMVEGLFWSMEQKDPEFKWAFWEKTPQYPLYDPKTSAPLNPKTGEFPPEEE